MQKGNRKKNFYLPCDEEVVPVISVLVTVEDVNVVIVILVDGSVAVEATLVVVDALVESTLVVGTEVLWTLVFRAAVVSVVVAGVSLVWFSVVGFMVVTSGVIPNYKISPKYMTNFHGNGAKGEF